MTPEKPQSDRLMSSPDEALIPTNYAGSFGNQIAGHYYTSEMGGLDNLQLGEIGRRIRKHKLLIAIIVLIVTAVVAVEAYRTKSVYRASATLQLELENHVLFRSGDMSVESEGADNAYLTGAAMKTKIRLLQSRPLLEDVVASLRLDQNQRFLDVTQRKNILESIQTIMGKFKGL